MRSARASSLTGRSRPLSSIRIRRRCGSATALNASEVVAARATGPTVYVDIGICQKAVGAALGPPPRRASGPGGRLEPAFDARGVDVARRTDLQHPLALAAAFELLLRIGQRLGRCEEVDG